MPPEITRVSEFRIELRTPVATRADINLGEAMLILMYGYSDLAFLNGAGQSLLTDWEVENHRLLLLQDGIYRLGIFPRPPSTETVTWSDNDWKLIEADHAAREAAVDAENKRRWEAAKPRWELNLSKTLSLLVPLEQTLRETVRDGRGRARSKEWLRHRDLLWNRRSLKRAIAFLQRRLREGQIFVDPPRPPSRQSPFARILRGPHKDAVTPAGYPCAHAQGQDCEAAARGAAEWLRKHGRSAALKFYGVPSNELVVGPPDLVAQGLRRQPIPPECFIKEVDFDPISDRIHPFSPFEEAYSVNVEAFAASLHASEPSRSRELQQQLNAWSCVTVHHQNFKELVAEFERSPEQKKKRSLADERYMAERLAEQLRAGKIAKKEEASGLLRLGVRDQCFLRIWAAANSLAGRTPRPGRPRKAKTPRAHP